MDSELTYVGEICIYPSVSADVAQTVIALRRKHPRYGAQMIHDMLVQRDSTRHWPAASSIGELLKRESLIRPRGVAPFRWTPGGLRIKLPL